MEPYATQTRHLDNLHAHHTLPFNVQATHTTQSEKDIRVQPKHYLKTDQTNASYKSLTLLCDIENEWNPMSLRLVI
jgi:hypothetical protein